MKLRTRLIVAFLLLSVVPLGVVTFYSYRSNVDAMQEVAAREADLLAGELTQRMQLVTTQLSERIEHLMDMPSPMTTYTQVVRNVPAETAPAVPVAPAPTAAPAPTSPGSSTSPATLPSPTGASAAVPMASGPMPTSQYNQEVANALGEAAILLNSVQMQPGRGYSFRGDGRGPDGRGGGGGAQGRGANAQGRGGTGPGTTPADLARAPSGANGATPGMASAPPARHFMPKPGLAPEPPASPAGTSSSAPAGTATGLPAPNVTAPPMPGGLPPGTITLRLGGAGAPTGAADDSTQIDLTQIRRDLYRQILPNGQPDALTPQERQRIASEVNQRMLGIVQGIKLSAVEIQKQAEAARVKAANESARSVGAAGKSAAPALAPPTAPAVPPAPVAPAPPAAPVQRVEGSSAAMKRTTALTGNRLNVQVTQNGEVVRAANAEINLPNLLMTVFTTMPRESGEVPFAVDKDGKLYSTSDDDKKKIESLGTGVTSPTAPLGKTELPGWIVVTTAEPSGSGLRFGIARPIGDSLTALRQTAGRNAAFGLMLIAVALAGVAPLSTRLTRNLSTLTDGVKRIAGGDYRARVAVHTHDEVGALAVAFNQMAEDVERHQRAAVEQERIRRELELGRQIQHDMQPHGALRLGLTEITGVSVSAREVGGDFFNYFELATGHIAMLVGDVSGKGVGAALLMANIQASLRTRLSLGQDLQAVAEEIDRDIEANAPGPLYATLFVGILDPVTRKLRYVNAGHHPQFVLHHDGALERMPSTGMPVGLLAGHGYRQVEVQLTEGDRLFFYTDGCVEAENEKDDMFGAERLESVFKSVPADATPNDVIAHVERAIEQFRGSRELFDDVTVMAVRVG